MIPLDLDLLFRLIGPVRLLCFSTAIKYHSVNNDYDIKEVPAPRPSDRCELQSPLFPTLIPLLNHTDLI